MQGLGHSPAADHFETHEFARDIGTGESRSVSYDRVIAADAVEWIARHGNDDQPRVLPMSVIVYTSDHRDMAGNCGLWTKTSASTTHQYLPSTQTDSRRHSRSGYHARL